jgi:nucleotidyltransferase/DNA polymerase involved in DNA repair
LYKNDTASNIYELNVDSETHQKMDNPFITIIQTKTFEYTNSDTTSLNSTSAFTYSFNVRNYIKDEILDEEQLTQDITTQMDKLVAKRKTTLENKAKENEQNIIKTKNRTEIYSLRDKKYTLSDLYGADSKKLKQ